MATPTQDNPKALPHIPSPQPPSTTTNRRLPPPCWSHDETMILIDAYREKWYSLRRGNLRATHWQEVADSIAVKYPIIPPKTSVQCRHKMEKLRKRYRAEIQRAYATPSGRYCSSWVHFNKMDSMEKGGGGGSSTLAAVPVNTGPVDREEDDEFDDDSGDPGQDLYSNSVKSSGNYSAGGFYGSVSNGFDGGSGGGSGFKIRLPRESKMGLRPEAKIYKNFGANSSENPSHRSSFYSNLGSTKVSRDGYVGKFGMGKRSGGGAMEGVGKRKEVVDPVAEMVGAIKGLGDGFVRMEKMKMEMAREVEEMRMEMEAKRTEMILESQQMIVEAFAKAFSERKNKKAKRMPMPEA